MEFQLDNREKEIIDILSKIKPNNEKVKEINGKLYCDVDYIYIEYRLKNQSKLHPGDIYRILNHLTSFGKIEKLKADRFYYRRLK